MSAIGRLQTLKKVCKFVEQKKGGITSKWGQLWGQHMVDASDNHLYIKRIAFSFESGHRHQTKVQQGLIKTRNYIENNELRVFLCL